MLLAARLEEMRDIMDRLHVVREMRELVKYATPENWHAPAPWIRQQTRAARIATYLHEVRLNLSHNSDAIGASHVMHTQKDDLILSCLKKARLRAYLIKRNMAALETDDEREVYIIQQFIVHSLRGFSNYIAYRHFFEEFDSRWDARVYMGLHYVCMVLVPLYLAGLIFYIFVFGTTLDAYTANFWFTEILIVFFIAILFVIPITILLKNIVITHWARKEVLALFKILKTRSNFILSRTTGMITNANALMHHFNPACRAARSFPSIPAARLLICLNDFDIPDIYKDELQSSLYYQVVHIPIFPIFFVFFITFMLPYTIQDAIIEAFSITGFNFLMLGLYTLVMSEIYTALILAVGIVILLFIVYRFRNKYLKIRRIVPSSIRE
jgi:hypothetical protein